MTYHEYPIHPRLNPFVKVIYSLEGAPEADNIAPWRILPDTCVVVVLHMATPYSTTFANGEKTQQPHSFVMAQMRQFVDISRPVKRVFDAVPMASGKAKGQFTYAQPLPAIYKKTSLTFDYWVPKILEWTEDIRSKNLREWRGEAILAHESCTDFMRICLLFLAAPDNQPPIAKAEDREVILTNWFGLEFRWLKKSAKREDILENNHQLMEGFQALNRTAGIDIPLEAWSRLQNHAAIKSLFK